MKKVLIIIITLLLITGCGKKKEEIPLIKITLDINPSIELTIKEDKIDSIKALNEDAKKVMDKELKGESLEEALKWLINRSVDLDYIEGEQAVVLVMIDGNYDQDELRRLIANPLGERNRGLDMIVIDKTTKEDEKLAKENNISIAKAHYINELAKERNITPEDYINKSIREIKETKDTGNTCPEDYTLEGDFCIKEIGREDAVKGKICPDHYYEYKGKCYEDAPIIDTDNYSCREGRLEKDKCILERTENAIPSKYTCNKGEAKTRGELGLTNKDAGDYNNIVCVDTSNATHPVSPCELNDGTEHTTSGGKCYWHRAGVLPSGCPGKILVNGECWDDASNILICKGARDGRQYKSRSEYCENSIKYIEPIVSEYKCEGNAKLNGNKCIITESIDAERERTCKEGFTLIDNAKCLNYNNIKDHIEGYRCDKENTRLEDNMCIILDIKEANKVE